MWAYQGLHRENLHIREGQTDGTPVDKLCYHKFQSSRAFIEGPFYFYALLKPKRKMLCLWTSLFQMRPQPVAATRRGGPLPCLLCPPGIHGVQRDRAF